MKRPRATANRLAPALVPGAPGTCAGATRSCFPWHGGVLLLALAMGSADGAAASDANAKHPWEPVPKPTPVAASDPAQLDAAIRRGVDFLLSRQNPHGSWGSGRNTTGMDIYAPVPGAHDAFRAAVTALCVSALIESADHRVDVDRAIDRGEAWLLGNLPTLRRASPEAVYNNWGHGYAIQALVHLYRRHPNDAARQAEIKRQIAAQIGFLERYECLDGGWAYYDFKAHTQQPSGSTLSFMTGAVLISLFEAREIGIQPPQRLIDRAMASIHRQRKPDFSYLYGEYLKYRPMMDVNRPPGSLGRSQVCNVATRLWGDKLVTDEVLAAWLDLLFARNLWLDLGRKRPIPHESWFHVAGYFFYFGHYYAARAIELLPPGDRDPYRAQLAQVLLGVQEKDGSWWDFPLYDYHQPYGTSFALMSLVRCKRPER
jgi:hypothetical protein